MKIRIATVDDIASLDEFTLALGKSKIVEYFSLQLEAQGLGKRLVLLADIDDEIAGYCVLNWEPKYPFFKKMGFPEVQDLNVAPAHRRKGYARAMISHCEDLAREKGLSHMGIGVGMDASYGPAQILYTNMGYVPDGHGITYDRGQVASGEFRPVDDDLCLMMVKDLEA